jgi:hypothetical protein
LSPMQNNPRVNVSQARLRVSGNASNDCADPNQRTAFGNVKCRIFMHTSTPGAGKRAVTGVLTLARRALDGL